MTSPTPLSTEQCSICLFEPPYENCPGKSCGRICRLETSLFEAQGTLATLADTVAAAIRNNGHNSDEIGLNTDLREWIWRLSYDYINARGKLAERAPLNLRPLSLSDDEIRGIAYCACMDIDQCKIPDKELTYYMEHAIRKAMKVIRRAQGGEG